MHVQLEFMLDMSYDMYKMRMMLKPMREATRGISQRLAIDSELRRMLREAMENPKK